MGWGAADDRVASGAKAYEKAENPLYVLQNNLQIDTQWYVNILQGPVTRVFEPILGDNVHSLFGPRPTLRCGWLYLGLTTCPHSRRSHPPRDGDDTGRVPRSGRERERERERESMNGA
jgi:hypothetical protein